MDGIRERRVFRIVPVISDARMTIAFALVSVAALGSERAALQPARTQQTKSRETRREAMPAN
jgi:hypothetical protein